MTLTATNEGDSLMLQYVTSKAAQADLQVRLFSNSITPGKTDVQASYVECTAASGYAPATLTAASWAIAQSSNTTAINYPALTFIFTGVQQVYGYYITSGGKCLWAENFGLENIPSGGGSIILTPSVTLN